MPGRLTLGLYNCYDPKIWHDIMRITLARAAPIAAAFNCDLATFGFPYAQARRRGAKRNDLQLDSPSAIAAFVNESSSIGDGGEYLLGLAEERKFHLQPFLDEAVATQPFGRLVATTPSPDPKKQCTPRDVAQELASKNPQLLLFGLGPRGLPAHVLSASHHHLELTGKGISLETATALGALPAMISAHLEHLKGVVKT